VFLPTLARRDTTDNRGAVLHGFFCVESRVLTGDTLDNDA